MLLRHALPGFWAEQGLPAHGGNEGHIDWVGAFGLKWPIPNPPVRKAIIPMHDAHHIVTGYGTDTAGEAEVAAWALGAGGPGPLLGWVYDCLAFGVGLLQAPVRTTRAFYAGRGCQTVYELGSQAVLDMDLDALRTHTRVDALAEAAPLDHVAYAKGLLLAAVMPVVALPLLVIAMLQPTHH